MSPPPRLLFITSTRIGDAVLSTGLLRHLIAEMNGPRVTIAAGPAAAPASEPGPVRRAGSLYNGCSASEAKINRIASLTGPGTRPGRRGAGGRPWGCGQRGAQSHSPFTALSPHPKTKGGEVAHSALMIRLRDLT